MRTCLFYLNWSLVWILFSSCQGGKEEAMPISRGQAYEVLVVADQEVWKGPAGRALYRALDTDIPGLPQPERSFHLRYVSPSDYTTVLKQTRNVLIVSISDTLAERPRLKVAKDVYASPQAVLMVQSPDETSFAEFVSENGKEILDYLTREEIERQVKTLERHYNYEITALVKQMFDCGVHVPERMSIYKTGQHFLWASTNAATAEQNFIIYTYPYEGEAMLTRAGFVHKRDSVMRINIPGAEKGMYMMTDSLLTDIRPMLVQEKRVWEARGLWRVKGDMMGGPFVSHAQADSANRRWVVVEVFVYSPGRKKRDLVRQAEASLYTLQLPDEDL